MSRTVIFDFDGTLALGRGPIEAYVRDVVATTGDSAFAAAVSEQLGEFESGRSNAIDAYDVVRQVATERGVDAEALEGAYLRSRSLLATADVPVEAPEGIAPFLERLADAAELVLATNAPSTRLGEALAVLGIDHVLQTCHTSVGKPQGLSALVADALMRGPVLSVGDIYENDLEPAAILGADTALVGPAWRSFAARTTMAAATLPELYSLIEVWAGVTTPAPPVPPGTGPTP